MRFIANLQRMYNLVGTIGIYKTFIICLQAVFFKPVKANYFYHKYSHKYLYNLIFITGLAKSGSTWFADMICELEGYQQYVPIYWDIKKLMQNRDDYMNIYPGIGKEFRKKLAVVKGHTWGYEENIVSLQKEGISKYFITVRDPRDSLISEYWYVRKQKYHPDYLSAKTMDLGEYIEYKINSGEFLKQRLNWIKMWIENRDSNNSQIIRYEDLLHDTYNELEKAFSFIGIHVEKSEIERIINKYSFSTITGRTRGQEDTKSFVRKGVVGEWETVFTQKQLNKIKKIWPGNLRKIGYYI